MRYKNNKIMSVYLMLGMVLLVIGFSYAFFIYNKTGLYTHTITGGKMKVIYDEVTGNNILIENAYPRTDEEALTYGLEFEFTVTGYNESEKNVYYAIEMDYGDDLNGKNRFLDTDIKLSLYENENMVFENEIFNNLDNQDIHYNYFRFGTSSQSPTVNNYKLRLWINDNVIISDTLSNDLNTWGNYEWDWLYESYPDKYEEVYNGDDLYLSDYGISIYTSDEFSNSYANFKVNIKADLTYDAVGYLMYDANGGLFTPKKTSLLTGRVTTEKPIMENKGFLGWSSEKDAEEPEYKSGDVYNDNAGGELLYAVWTDTMNVMSDLTAFSDYEDTIQEIYFISEIPENIELAKETADLVVDLTLDNQGSVTGLLYGDILYIASFGTTYLSTGYRLFHGFSNISTIDFANGDSYYVENMESMFSFGSGGQTFESNENNDYQIMPLGDIYESGRVFYNFDNFKTNNVKTMHKMFYEVDNIDGLPLEIFNTSNVEDMSYMFSYTYINELDLSSFDTSNVTTMSNMFAKNMNLRTINLSSFNTSKVTDMSSMFNYCRDLENLNLKSFDTSNVTDMSGMFWGYDGHYNAMTLIDISHFDTSSVVDMSGMFGWQMRITTLDLSNFDTSNVTDMSSMFYECRNLETINFDNFNTINVTDMSFMFYGFGNSSPYLDLTSFDTNSLINMQYMFAYTDLEMLDISSFVFNFDVLNYSKVFQQVGNDKIIIYVPNADIQDWIINRLSKGPGGDRPSYSWDTDNIIIKN